jgi:hypothetical protein
MADSGRPLATHGENWREHAGLKGADAAARLRWSPSKISKMEHAAQGIQPVDVLALGLIYQADPDERDKLFDDAQKATEGGWWQEYGEHELIEITRDYLELESEAILVQDFKTDLIPGLLQTRDYAAALAQADIPEVDEETVSRRAEVKITRQALLDGENPVRVEAVLGEAALRTPVGGRVVLRDQLRQLVRLAERPNIVIRVLPFEHGAYPAVGSPFTVLRFAEDHYDDVAYVENLKYGLLLEEPATVETYKLHFAGVRDIALDPDESIAMIAKAARR